MSVMPEMATKNPVGRPSATYLGKTRRIRLTPQIIRKWRETMESLGFSKCSSKGSNSKFAEDLLRLAVNKKLVRSQEAPSTSSFYTDKKMTINVTESVFRKWRDFMMVSGFNLSTDSEFAEALLSLVDLKKKAFRVQVTSSTLSSSATSSSAARQSGESSTVNHAQKQSQIFFNIDIMGTDTNQLNASEGSSATAIGNPVPKVIVTSFDPKADSFAAAFSNAAESQLLACKVPSENNNKGTLTQEEGSPNSSEREVAAVQNCDVQDPKGSSCTESVESCSSTSDCEIIEVKSILPQKRRKEPDVDNFLADLTSGSVDPLSEETLFGVVLTNYRKKLCQVEIRLDEIKEEKEKDEATLKRKWVEEKHLKKELDVVRKDISKKQEHLEELRKKKELLSTEKSFLKYKVLHCEALLKGNMKEKSLFNAS